MTMFGKARDGILVALLLCALTGVTAAQEAFPNRPMRLIVPYPAGGTSDTLARALGNELHSVLGQPVVIENRPGGGTAIAAQVAAKSPPDGYTLLFVSDQTMTTLPMLRKNLPFDPQKDFVPVIALAYMDWVLVANPSLGIGKLEELVALAKSKPGSLNYGSFGIGSPAHLGMELFKQVADLSIAHIPSKGVAQVVTDLLGGSVQIALLGISGAPLIKAGKVNALGLANSKRSSQLPDVPTFAEKGYPDMYVKAWWGIIAPAGTPKDVVDKLNAAFTRIVNDPEFRQKRMISQGLEPYDSSQEAFAKLIREDTKHWQKVVDLAKITPE
jgi:tripartite-type tricarboxylate transporter receptor subunit TctC